MTAARVHCAERLELTAITALPLVHPGDDLVTLLLDALNEPHVELRRADVLVIASKVISRVEGRFVDLSTLSAGEQAKQLAESLGLDERWVQLVLDESVEVSRTAPGVLITRNRHGVVCANAGIDLSNARPRAAPPGTGPWALKLPEKPDESAERLRVALSERAGVPIGVIISDSVGRPFRLGSVGIAIGVAGLPALYDQRGSVDLFGRTLEHTVTALADQVATAADLVAGQAAERRGAVHVRGLQFSAGSHSARELVRASELDLYAGPPPTGAKP